MDIDIGSGTPKEQVKQFLEDMKEKAEDEDDETLKDLAEQGLEHHEDGSVIKTLGTVQKIKNHLE